MKKIGIFGGTFDPIHNGHLNLADKVSEVLNLDKVLIIPASVPPHKRWLQITDSKHRYEMCRLACQGNKLYEVSDIEIKREGSSYTAQTIGEISEIYKKSKLYILMGSDSFLSVSKWYRFDEIIKLATICTVARNEEELLKLNDAQKFLHEMGADTVICDVPIVPISSTTIRNNIRNGYSIDDMVSEKVADYIKRNCLYKQKGSDFNG